MDSSSSDGHKPNVKWMLTWLWVSGCVSRQLGRLFSQLTDQLFGSWNVRKCLVLSTNQTYSVYCQRGVKKPENIHV